MDPKSKSGQYRDPLNLAFEPGFCFQMLLGWPFSLFLGWSEPRLFAESAAGVEAGAPGAGGPPLHPHGRLRHGLALGNHWSINQPGEEPGDGTHTTKKHQPTTSKLKQGKMFFLFCFSLSFVRVRSLPLCLGTSHKRSFRKTWLRACGFKSCKGQTR